MNQQHLERAKEVVKQRLRGQPWFTGIGSSSNPPMIIVYVTTDHPMIPQYVQGGALGIPIAIRVVGEVNAQAGTVGASKCPCCGMPIEDGYVRSPDLNPLDGAVPMEHQAAALSTQKKESFHPAFYIMAAASVTGVIIELARYWREKNK